MGQPGARRSVWRRPRGAIRGCVGQLPDEPLARFLGDLPGFHDKEPFALHMSDSLAKQSLRSLTTGRTRCDTDVLLVIDERREVELAQVVQLRAAAGGGPAPPPAAQRPAGVA
jgi:hypothetical protein